VRPYYDHAGITIYHGDCREILSEVPGAGVVITDPPYSVGRSETEFSASGNIACCLHLASLKAPAMFVFSTSSGRGYEFVRSSIRALPHCRTLCWHRSYVNSPAAGPWRWDLVLIQCFGRAAFGRPEWSSLIQTDGTMALALETGHRAPVPVEVMAYVYRPFAGATLLDPFCGSGSSLLAARQFGAMAIGIEIEERYCETAAKRLGQEVLSFASDERETASPDGAGRTPSFSALQA
jgi:site-specific DNA-methyltransferase (adenine-specific)